MRVLFDRKVEDYLTELIEILYEKEYFGFKESAYKYVDELIDSITSSINITQKKQAPEYFSKYGKELYYAVFKKNDNTQWYVFFNYENEIYFIRYIGSNHTIAQYMIP